MCAMKYINEESPYNFQWKKLKVKTDDLIAKITNIHLCRMGSDRKYLSIPNELLLGANSIIY